MKFVLEIVCDNSSFDESPEDEVARILSNLAEDIRNGDMSEQLLFDVNGNYVGSSEFVDPLLNS